jgi:hypothetical protein
LGIVGHVGSTVNSGGRGLDCAWASKLTHSGRAKITAAHARGQERSVVFIDRDDTPLRPAHKALAPARAPALAAMFDARGPIEAGSLGLVLTLRH